MIKALYDGQELPLAYQTALRSKGLTDKDIEDIENRVYSDSCCERFHDVNYANPVIDYATGTVEYYEALMPYLKDGQMAHRRERWDFCPFCGKALRRG